MKEHKDYKSIFNSFSSSTQNQKDKQLNTEREQYSLSLRKKKMNNYLMKRREENVEESQIKKLKKNPYEIIPEKLEISEEIRNKTYYSPSSFSDAMINLLESQNINEIKFAIYHIRNQTLRSEFPIEEMYKKNIVDKLMMTIFNNINKYDIVYEITWALINFSIRINNDNLMIFLTNIPCIQIYIKIFDLNDKSLTENVLWLISNIIIGCDSASENIFFSPIPRKYLLQFVENKEVNNQITKICIKLFSSLSQFINTIYRYIQIEGLENQLFKKHSDVNVNNIQENIIYLEEHLTKIFLKFVNFNDQEIINDCIFGLSNLSNSSNIKIHDLIYSNGLIGKIISNQINSSDIIFHKILELIGNFLSNFTGVIEPIFQNQIISFILKFINSKNNCDIKRNSFWIISNLLCIPNVNVINIVNSGIIPFVIDAIQNSENKVGIEGLFIINDIIFNENYIEAVINFIKNYEIIKILVSVIQKFYEEPEALKLILVICLHLFEIGNKYSNLFDGKNIFLEEFQLNGGNLYIEKLQNYNDQIIYNYVETIIRVYFNTSIE